jgi:glycosyltransferase involved in cell wall biosynthesis
VGTITENKRPLEILEVLFALHAEGVNFNATFVGRLGAGGRYEARFAVRLLEASRLGFADHKEHLAAGALAEAMAEAHALIHFPREEAFGLVVAEAMSQGMTIFASRVGELAELCNNYPECYLIDEEIDLGTTIKQWAQSNPLRLHRDAPSWNMQPYLPKQNARLTLNAYREAIESLI